MARTLSDIPTPALIVDVKALDRNIRGGRQIRAFFLALGRGQGERITTHKPL